jgi:hypothetical protein
MIFNEYYRDGEPFVEFDLSIRDGIVQARLYQHPGTPMLPAPVRVSDEQEDGHPSRVCFTDDDESSWADAMARAAAWARRQLGA